MVSSLQPRVQWHQAVVFFAGSEDPQDAAMQQRLPWMFLVSVLMVAAQVATVAAVIIGTATPACFTNDQCGRGQYCSIGWSNRCQFWYVELPLEIFVTNDLLSHTTSHERWCLHVVEATCP